MLKVANVVPSIGFLIVLLALAFGVLVGHVTFYARAVSEFKEEAGKLHTDEMIDEWLHTGYITVDESTQRRIEMVDPIEYWTSDHIEHLIYGALVGVVVGIVLALVLTLPIRRNHMATEGWADLEGESCNS